MIFFCGRSVAGNWLFVQRRWRDPEIETDRKALEEGYGELVAAFPAFSRCSRDHFIATIADKCASWTRCMRYSSASAADSPQPYDSEKRKRRGKRPGPTAGSCPSEHIGYESVSVCNPQANLHHPGSWPAFPASGGIGAGAGVVQLEGNLPWPVQGHGPTDSGSDVHTASPALGSAAGCRQFKLADTGVGR